MSRVNFRESITISGGPNGTLMPLQGISLTPYTVNSDGSEGAMATAWEDRTSQIQATPLTTDAAGNLSFWLDAGDYNIHVSDPQSPPRIQSYIIGFTAPIVDTSQVITQVTGLIAFPGDLKFSVQAADHGLKADGSYEYLHVTSDATDGGGRKIDHTVYNGLWQAMGSPAPDAQGMFRLPNVSGRAMVAAGAASGLTARALNDMIGEENHLMSNAEMPVHHHGGATGTGATGTGTTGGGTTGTDSPDHTHTAGGGVINSVSQGTVYNAGGTGNSGATGITNMWNGSIGTGGASARHAHSVPALSVPSLSVPALSIANDGGGTAHNNMQPSYGMNLFVKT